MQPLGREATEALLRASDEGEIRALADAIGFLITARTGNTGTDLLDELIDEADDVRTDYI